MSSQLINEIADRKFTKATAASNKALLSRAQNGDPVAREQLQMSNLPMVIKIASKWANNGLDVDDLISEGSIALTHAIDKFDTSTGNAFSSYAYISIERAIQRAIEYHGGLIKLPANSLRDLGDIKKARAALGGEACHEDLAEKTGLPVERVKALLEARVGPAELVNGGIANEEGVYYPADLIEPDFASMVIEGMEQEQTRRKVHKALRTLTPNQARAVRLVHGFDGEAVNASEAARMMNVSRERVSQHLKAAYKTLAPILRPDTVLCDEGHLTIGDPRGIPLLRLPCGCAVATASHLSPQLREQMIRELA